MYSGQQVVTRENRQKKLDAKKKKKLPFFPFVTLSLNWDNFFLKFHIETEILLFESTHRFLSNNKFFEKNQWEKMFILA